MHSGRLIIVCGSPGAGKTTLAKTIESQPRALPLSPDEWMDALDINLWDERSRAKIEALQWTLAQQLLKLGLRVLSIGERGNAQSGTL
jgi:predicted kinase